MSVEVRFENLGSDRLNHEEGRERHPQQRPARRCRKRERPGDQGCSRKAKVRNEAQHCRQSGPKGGVRQTDPGEDDPQDDADAEIDGNLSPEIARQPFAGIVDGGGRSAQVGAADQADEPVPKRFVLEQYEE